MTRRFLILQLRPETEAADDEYQAFLTKAVLNAEETHRIRLDQERLDPGLDPRDYCGVIVGGGPGCVSDPIADKPPLEARIESDILSLMPQISEGDLPFLGCCYGIGILGAHLGADVNKTAWSEPVGTTDCTLTPDGKNDPLLADLPAEFQAFVGHKEALQELPSASAHLISSPTCPFQMIRHKSNIYATQFHPEADGEGFATRIRVYRDRGYFPPEDAATLTEMCQAANVYAPAQILRNFVERYRQR